MNSAKLIKMANQISQFFAADDDQTRAMAGVADHIKRFWDPRMRRELLAQLAADPSGADPLVVATCQVHRHDLMPG